MTQKVMFESSVNLQGNETFYLRRTPQYLFESSVNLQGNETAIDTTSNSGLSLRVV